MVANAANNQERNAILTPLARSAAAGDLDSKLRLLRIVDSQRLAAPAIRNVLGSDPQLEDEALAAALVEVALSIHGFRSESEFLTWLHTIAGRTAQAVLTTARRHRHEEFKPGTDVMSMTRRLSSMVASREAMLSVIEDAFASLSPELAETLRLREIDQLSYAEISDRLDLPIGTVRSRVHRARQQVADAMRASGLDFDG